MKCGKCREQFTDYLEGALPAPQREQMAAHLRQCPDCAEELEAFRRTVAALQGLKAVPPPANLLPSIKQALATEAPSAPPRFGVSWQHLGAVAAAAALVVGFVAVFSYQQHMGSVLESPGQQVAGTVPEVVPSPSDMEEKPARPATIEEERAVGEAPTVSLPSRKSVPIKTRRETKETSGREVDTTADREQPRPSSSSLASKPKAMQGEVEPAIAPPKTLREEQVVPDTAGGLAGPGAGKRVPLGVGSYGRSSTPLAGANVEAGAKVVITPPSLEERIIGQPVDVRVSIQPQASVEKAVVRVQPQGSLRLAEQRPIIYQGPLSADEPKQLSFTIIASESGTQQCQVEVSSELPGVAASTTVAIPGFEAPPKHITTQVFEDTPLDQAIRAVAREADMEVSVGDGLSQKRVTYDFSEGVPGEAALRILAEIGGCQLEVDDGTYRIHCPADNEGE